MRWLLIAFPVVVIALGYGTAWETLGVIASVVAGVSAVARHACADLAKQEGDRIERQPYPVPIDEFILLNRWTTLAGLFLIMSLLVAIACAIASVVHLFEASIAGWP